MPLDAYVARAGPDGARPARCASGRRGGATCTATAPISRACSPSSTISASTRSTTTFAPPATPDGITGAPLPRTTAGPARACSPAARPSGCRSCSSRPRSPARAQELRDWADFVHIRHIAEAAVPGYAMITPYENVTGGDPRFMHFYEMDTDDPETRVQGDDTARDAIASAATGTDAFKHWAFGPEPAHHVRQHVRARRRSATGVTDRDSSPSSRASARAARSPTTPVSDDDDRAAPRRRRRTRRAPRTSQPWEFVVVRDADRASRDRRAHRGGRGRARGRAFSETRLVTAAARRGRAAARPAASRPRR